MANFTSYSYFFSKIITLHLATFFIIGIIILLKKRLTYISFIFLLFILVTSSLTITTTNDLNRKFNEYKNLSVNEKLATVKISRDLNYISRCSRDIMLGGDFNNNYQEIKQRINTIKKNFEIVENSFSLSQKEQVGNLLSTAKNSTYDFMHEVVNKMQLVKNGSNLDEVYALYKLESSPKAIKSRKYFQDLIDKQNILFEKVTKTFERDIKYQREIVFSSALLLSFFILAGVLYIYRSILSHLKTQEELQDTKNLLVQYKNAIDKTNIVSKTDLKGNITYVNDEFCKVSLFSKYELLNQPHNIVRHPNNSKEVFEDLWSKIRNKESWHGVIKNRKKDGSSYFVDTSIFPIIDKNGITNEYIAIRKDISEFIELNEQLVLSQNEILARIGTIAETRSKETSNHVRRVAEYSKVIATSLGMKEKEIEILYNATALHDIGKIVIPDYILEKPSALNEEEFEIVKTHAENGYHMLKDTNNEIIKAGATIAYEHHEKYDGSGYPRNLKGEGIHIYARITAIADVFDALGSKRTYKDPWDLNKIKFYINSESGKHFDPRLVEIFNEKFDDFVFIRKKFRSEY